MNLSISNIGWAAENDEKIYRIMQDNGFSGLEIAPTRIFPKNPYENLKKAEEWKTNLYSKYGFSVPSIQSIWYGRSEKIWGSDEERDFLLAYTKKAIHFAEIIGCGNIVFGCPRNRCIPDDVIIEDAVQFFKTLGDYAVEHQTVIAMEANPPIYNTNFLNTTKDAIAFIEKVNSNGFLLNLDLGTMIENDESVGILLGKEHLINHVHISEPGLKPIRKRKLHSELASMLRINKYNRFISIEVCEQENISMLAEMMEYIRGYFE